MESRDASQRSSSSVLAPWQRTCTHKIAIRSESAPLTASLCRAQFPGTTTHSKPHGDLLCKQLVVGRLRVPRVLKNDEHDVVEPSTWQQTGSCTSWVACCRCSRGGIGSGRWNLKARCTTGSAGRRSKEQHQGYSVSIQQSRLLRGCHRCACVNDAVLRLRASQGPNSTSSAVSTL